ncbi:MAG TPA: DUF1254 domain-containing protein [Planctomycetota bacterium]|nr:DUF1254 domain-containing protein [Planctomycetota bacterium]
MATSLGRTVGVLLAAHLAACTFMRPSAPAHADAVETRRTATDAFLYGYPIVRSYGILMAHAGDPKNPEFQAPWNELRHRARLATPDDPGPATPALDTVSSWLGIDLRSEPLLLTLPVLEKNRTYWIQLIDLVKNTPIWLSSRTAGNGGGVFLLAKPGWAGEKPPGIRSVVSIETDLALAVFRIQLFGPDDLDAVQKIQAGITIQRLSSFLKHPAPPVLPLPMAVEPLNPDEERGSPRFFAVLAYALQFCPAPRAEQKLRARFSRIGLVAGKPFDPQDRTPEIREALEDGIADAWKAYQDQKKLADAKDIPIGDLPGTPDFPRNPFLARFAGSLVDPLESPKELTSLPLAPYDWDGLPLDGSTYRYVLHFYPDLLPPAAGFWSLTIYDQPSGLLIPNPLRRYVLQSSMPGLAFDEDGGLTIRVQADSPGAALESNWLPASRGRFLLILRLYDPKPETGKTRWTPPYLEKAK